MFLCDKKKIFEQILYVAKILLTTYLKLVLVLRFISAYYLAYLKSVENRHSRSLFQNDWLISLTLRASKRLLITRYINRVEVNREQVPWASNGRVSKETRHANQLGDLRVPRSRATPTHSTLGLVDN